MSLHWYGWVGLVVFSVIGAVETWLLVVNAWRGGYIPRHVLMVALWWTLAVAVLIAGASP